MRENNGTQTTLRETRLERQESTQLRKDKTLRELGLRKKKKKKKKKKKIVRPSATTPSLSTARGTQPTGGREANKKQGDKTALLVIRNVERGWNPVT